MSARAMGRVWELDLPPDEKLVLLWLADGAGGGGQVEIVFGLPDEIVQRATAYTGLSTREVERCLRELALDGLLFWIDEGLGIRLFPMSERSVSHPLNRREEWDRKRARVAPRIFERDGHRCQECGATEEITVDHIVPISAGGTDDDGNLQTLCRSCNSRKGARLPEGE